MQNSQIHRCYLRLNHEKPFELDASIEVHSAPVPMTTPGSFEQPNKLTDYSEFIGIIGCENNWAVVTVQGL